MAIWNFQNVTFIWPWGQGQHLTTPNYCQWHALSFDINFVFLARILREIQAIYWILTFLAPVTLKIGQGQPKVNGHETTIGYNFPPNLMKIGSKLRPGSCPQQSGYKKTHRQTDRHTNATEYHTSKIYNFRSNKWP